MTGWNSPAAQSNSDRTNETKGSKQNTCTHTCSEVQNAVVLVVDRQHDVRHSVCDLVVCGQVERGHTDRSDHVLNLWVVSDHAEVLDVVLTSCGRVFEDTLSEEAMQLIQVQLRSWINNVPWTEFNIASLLLTRGFQIKSSFFFNHWNEGRFFSGDKRRINWFFLPFQGDCQLVDCCSLSVWTWRRRGQCLQWSKHRSLFCPWTKQWED